MRLLVKLELTRTVRSRLRAKIAPKDTFAMDLVLLLNNCVRLVPIALLSPTLRSLAKRVPLTTSKDRPAKMPAGAVHLGSIARTMVTLSLTDLA
jgi:hypothetical protein